MTPARVEKVPADREMARTFLAQARQFASDADVPGLSSESQVILLHNATVAACDAILQSVGRRVTTGDGAHMLRAKTALDELSENTEELFESLDASRARRNEASYAAGPVAQASVSDAREAVAELIELATGRLDS